MVGTPPKFIERAAWRVPYFGSGNEKVSREMVQIFSHVPEEIRKAVQAPEATPGAGTQQWAELQVLHKWTRETGSVLEVSKTMRQQIFFSLLKSPRVAFLNKQAIIFSFIIMYCP